MAQKNLVAKSIYLHSRDFLEVCMCVHYMHMCYHVLSAPVVGMALLLPGIIIITHVQLYFCKCPRSR